MKGLSLSLCVKDILAGLVDIDDVEQLVTGTRITSPSAMEGVIEHYMDGYWNNDVRAIGIVHTLWHSGRIYQPRVEGLEPPNICLGHWIDELGNQIHLKRSDFKL